MNKPLLGMLAAAITLAAACGTTVVEKGSGPGSGGSTSSSSTSQASTSGFVAGSTGAGGSYMTSGTSGNGGSTPTVLCPANPPAFGSACGSMASDVRCTYGTSVAPDCRVQWQCLDSTWTNTEPSCPTPAPGACPTAEPTSGVSCGTKALECIYGNDICECGCGGDIACQDFSWACSQPPAAPCPPVVPNTGVPCSGEGMTCTYGNPCEGGVITQCTSGEWTWENVACGG